RADDQRGAIVAHLDHAAGAADPDRRRRRRDLVLVAVDSADEARDGAHRALQQAEEAALGAVGLAIEAIVADRELALRLERHIGAVGESKLRAAFPGANRVAVVQLGAAKEGLLAPV